jgi:hypothetical protein
VTRTVEAAPTRPLVVERFVYATPAQPTAFAPPDTSIRLWQISARPARLVAIWTRDDDPRNRKDTRRPRTAGVVVWRRERFSGATRWRVVYERRYPAYANIYVETGDVTADGIPDVLHYDRQGSGGCGAHYLVGTVGTAEREIFRRESCETDYRIFRRVFMINQPIGPCPVSRAGAHCSGGSRLVRMRWTGTRLVPALVKVECHWPELPLEPARECRRRAT